MKISKTLKRLRSEKGITQEQLAQQLFITRQSVSSWENDRTQPDIDMLIRLSEIFGVSIEELIYGKKRNTELETEKPGNNMLLIIFSILGSLLAGTGIILIFVYFWQQLPLILRSALSLLPLLAGQSAGFFVLIKKRDSVSWCEGAGVLWTAGIAATLTMIYNIFSLGFDWKMLLVIECIFIIPILFMLKCVAPLIIFYGSAIVWFFASVSYTNSYFILVCTILLLALGCYFSSQMVKAEKKSIRSLYSHWISIFAVVIFIIILSFNLHGDLITALIASGASGFSLLLLSLRDPDISMPYRITGLLLSSVFFFAGGASYYGRLKAETENIVFLSVCVVMVISAFVYILITKTKIKDRFLISYIGTGFIALVIYSVILFLLPESKSGNHDETIITLMKIIAIIANILLMISGSKKKKLLPINMGFICVSAHTFLIVYQSGLSMLLNGFLLIVFGAALLIINYKLSAKREKVPVQVNTLKEADDIE